MSRKSRAGFLAHVRNLPRLSSYVTLTYPPASAPSDHRTTRRHLAAFLKRLTRKGVGAVYKFEFCHDGRPHVHLFLTQHVPESELRTAWAKVVGCAENPHLVKAKPLRDRIAAEWYTAKRRDARTNLVPESYANMGRWWGHCGPGSTPSPIVAFEGDAVDVAKIERAAKQISRSHRRWRPTLDGGLHGYALYNGGGEGVAHALERYALVLPGLRILRGRTAEDG